MERCGATTTTGNRCKNKVLSGKEYCRIHDKIVQTKAEVNPNDKNQVLYHHVSEAYKLSNPSFEMKDDQKLSEHITEIKKLLQDDIDPNYYPNNLLAKTGRKNVANTLLYQAIILCDFEIIEVLVNKKVNVMDFTFSYLEAAVKLQDSEDASKINKRLFQISSEHLEKKSVKKYIGLVVLRDEVELLQTVVDVFGEVDFALQEAVSWNKLESIKYLISRGATIRPGFYESPEIVEIYFEHLNSGLERYIIALAERIDDTDPSQVEFYKKLVTHYKNHYIFQSLINSAFYSATQRNNLQLMRYLLEIGADPNAIQILEFSRCQKDSLNAAIVYHDCMTIEQFVERLNLVLQHYKVDKYKKNFSKYISDLFDHDDSFLHERHEQELIKCFHKVGIPITSDHLRELDITIGLLENDISIVKSSKSRKKATLLTKLTDKLTSLTSFRNELHNLTAP